MARVLRSAKVQGTRRQVFFVDWGDFDTHAGQRGNGSTTQDAQLVEVAQAVAAFDEANRSARLDDNVVTLMLSDFGRTLRPGSGGGSEHGWGNHVFALGGPVAGGRWTSASAVFPASRSAAPTMATASPTAATSPPSPPTRSAPR